MEINFNLGSLKIVQTPLMEHFQKIQNNIEGNLIIMKDQKKIPTNFEAIDYLSKVQSTFKMIGLTGLMKVLGLVKVSLQEIKEVKFETAKSYEILLLNQEIIKKSIFYVQNLLQGEADRPTKLFSEYSKLSEIIGKDYSIKDLFNPKLELKNNDFTKNLKLGLLINGSQKKNIISQLEVAHKTIQSHLMEVFSFVDNANDDTSFELKNKHNAVCKIIYENIEFIQKLKLNKNIYILLGLQKLLVCIASPIFNEKFIEMNDDNYKNSLKFNFAKIDRNLKVLLEASNELSDGDKTSSLKVDDEIVKEVLFFVIKAIEINPNLKEMPVYKELEQYFNLQTYKEQLGDVHLYISLSQKSPEIMNDVERIFIEMKEQLLLLTSKQASIPDFFNQHVNKYISLLQKMEIIFNDNFQESSKTIIIKLKEVLNSVKESPSKWTDVIQKELSVAMVLIQYAIQNLMKTSPKEEIKREFEDQINLQIDRIEHALKNDLESLNNLPFPSLSREIKKSEEREALLAVFNKVNNEIKSTESILDQYLRSEGQEKEEFASVFKSLNTTRGILGMLGETDLSNMIKEISDIWGEIEKNGYKTEYKPKINHTIQLLGGISLFINALKDDNESQAKEIYKNILKKSNDHSDENDSQDLVLENELTTTELVEPENKNEVKEDIYNVLASLNEEFKDIKEVVSDKQISEISISEENNQLQKENVLFDENDSNTSLKDEHEINNKYDKDLLEVYILEANEVLEQFAHDLNLLKNDLSNKDLIINLRRYFHTLKGSGKMVGLDSLGESAWIGEDNLNKVLETDIFVNEKLINALEKSQFIFKKWITQLEASDEVDVNINEIKELFDDVIDNPEIKNSLPQLEEESIETFQLEIEPQTTDATLNEKEVEPEVELPEEIEKFVMINSEEVSETLLNMFMNESAQHLKLLNDYISQDSNVQLNKDFIRYAHTLGSIAKTVNFLKLSEIAHRLEVIGDMALERNYSLNSNQKDIVLFSIESLGLLRNSFDQDKNNLLDKASEKLELLQLEVLEENTTLLSKEENIENSIPYDDNEVANAPKIPEEISKEKSEDFTSLLKDIKLAISETVHQSLENVHSSISSVQKEISELSSKMKEIDKNQEIADQNKVTFDFASLESKIIDNISKAIEEKHSKIIEKPQEHQNHEQLLETIKSLEDAIGKLKDSQEELDKKYQDNLIGVRKEIRYFINALKKKSDLQNQTISGDGEIESDFNFELDIDDLDVSEEFKQLYLEELENEISDTEEKTLINSSLQEDEFIANIFTEKISTSHDEIDDEIFEISKLESEDLLDNIEKLMDNIIENTINLEENKELKRHLHTLKGSMRMSGANKIGMLAHRLESLLDYSEVNSISLFTLKSILSKEIEKIVYLMKNFGKVLTEDKLLWLDSYLYDTTTISESVINKSSSEVQIPTNKVSSKNIKENKQQIRIVADLVDDFINEAGEIRLTRTTLEGMIDGNKKSLYELKSTSNKINKMLKEVEIQSETQIQAHRDQMVEKGVDFDPLELDRFTRLQELTRLLNEALADIQDSVVSMEKYNKTQNSAISQQAILTNNLLDSLMKVRLTPVESISPRLYKITRDTAKELSKRVNLEFVGEKTEVDRLVLDKVISPLEHLLRNCIAHGIESPEERLNKGKSANGKILFKTYLEGNFIFMEISDDGAGINLDKVKKKAIEKGLLENGKNYDKDTIVDLIFSSGLSTADSISQVSGRGVGMDVVKSELNSLGGNIKISTEKDKGTIFTVVLPVALINNQAMLIENNGSLCAIPALIIDEIISFKEKELVKAYDENELSFRGKNYELIYLGHLTGITPINVKPEIKSYNTLILISYLGKSLVIHVDKLINTSEILIKSLGVYFNKIPGFIGATILGDGRQGLVINPVLLKSHYDKVISNEKTIINRDEPQTHHHMSDTITVMVVDDSLTVRRATSKVLERYGYKIVLAKDGEDALEQLQVNIPDIILSDIEMPRMDGFEFARNVRHNEKYSKIPIVMITSRTADKHKSLALEIGVNGFLGKPFQEEELINKIEVLTNTVKQ